MVLVGDVFVGDMGGNIEYDDIVLVVDVVIVMEVVEFFLVGSVLYIELDLIEVLCLLKYNLC